jgi:hypothetical protein
LLLELASSVGATANLDGVCAPPVGCHAGMDNGALRGIATLDNKYRGKRSGTNLHEAIRLLTLIVAAHSISLSTRRGASPKATRPR